MEMGEVGSHTQVKLYTTGASSHPLKLVLVPVIKK